MKPLYFRRVCLLIPCALALLAGMPSSCMAQITADDVKGARYTSLEPRALQLLQRMATAYAQTRILDQTTSFYSALIPLLTPASASASTPPPTEAELAAASGDNPDPDDESAKKNVSAPRRMNRSLRLLVTAPNRLRLEMQETDAETQRTLQSLWISNGATFWTYKQDKNWYTQEKAPKNLRDFAHLAHLNSGNLELLMLMGVNPFANVREQVKSVRCEGTATVHETPTDVVVLRAVTPAEETEARFYIGQEDGLLRRVIVDTTPVSSTARPGVVGDALDELIDGYTPPAPTGDGKDAPAAMRGFRSRMRVILDNSLNPAPNPGYLDFAFRPPVGAMLYDPLGKADYSKLSSRSLRIEDVLKGMQQSGRIRKGKLHIIKP